MVFLNTLKKNSIYNTFIIKYKEVILECLDVEDTSFAMNKDDVLDDIGWDSLSAINLLTKFSNDFSIDIDPDDLEKLRTVADLDEFLNNLMNDSI
jgi:acyl carrier protein